LVIVLDQLAVCVKLGRSKSRRANGKVPKKPASSRNWYPEYRNVNWLAAFSR
jgi:hypothetical protein